MEKFFAALSPRITLVFLFFFFGAQTLCAQDTIPELWGGHVHDEAKILSPATVSTLEQTLRLYEDSTSNQIAILIIPSLHGKVLEEYALHVAEKWKLGTAKKDNGVILLVAVDDHKMRIEVGLGLQGSLTDAQSNRIIRNEMAPNFRKGDYDAGVTDAVEAIIKVTRGEYYSDANTGSSDLSIGERLIIGVIVLGLLAIFTWTCLFESGCAGWMLYFFLLPFYAFFTWVSIGRIAGIGLFVIYTIGTPIAKILIGRSKWGKARIAAMKKISSSGGGGRRSSFGGGSSWSSGSSGGGYSGGGGSFNGGGSSGSW